MPSKNNTKIALITGIGRGIGKALAEKFLAEGYTVIGSSQTGTADFEHPNLMVLKLDLTDSASITTFTQNVAEALHNMGDCKLNVLINNAGVLLDGEITYTDAKLLRETLEVNLLGPISLTEKLLDHAAGGHIVNISIAGSLAHTDKAAAPIMHFPYHYPAYRISKCALNMYTRTLAMRLEHEYENEQINTHKPDLAEKNNHNMTIVSSVHPGWVKTDMGGGGGTMLPEEAASDIFALAVSRPETGQFWFKGEKCAW